uniref:Uncharacterized protein n=1 Tax=Arundo donax TaxID=35708 RepID=A0A0A9HIW5_ARUDO
MGSKAVTFTAAQFLLLQCHVDALRSMWHSSYSYLLVLAVSKLNCLSEI